MSDTHAAKSWRDMLQIHPAAELFPPMSAEELRELGEDIVANELREPVTLWRESLGAPAQLLDGRNRLDAIEAVTPLRVGEEGGFTVIKAEIGGAWHKVSKYYYGTEPVEYVIGANLLRRHLNESQRAMVAAKLATFSHGGDRSKSQICDLTQANTASLLNVGKRSVEHAAKVRERGIPELVDAVAQGQASVSAAAEVVALPEEEQREIVTRHEIPRAAKAIKAKRKRRLPDEILAEK
jgi:hypothetical protein